MPDKERLSQHLSPFRIGAISAAVGMGILLVACGGGEGDNAPDTVRTPTTREEECVSPEATFPDEGLSPEQRESIVHEVIATVFWIGEGATEEAGGISNVPTAWDSNAVETFGGADREPHKLRADFEPQHNTFYVALPASEYDEIGPLPGAREASPWADEASKLAPDESLFKGRWVKITNESGLEAYGQWVDVGPCAEQDYGYVFGDLNPSNTFRQKAGIDVSTDLDDYLDLQGSAPVQWEFVDEEEVPADGPWRENPAIDNETRWR